MNNNSYEHEEFYKKYCKEGSVKYTDANPTTEGTQARKIWDELSEIREVFSKYPCSRLKNPEL